MTHTIRAITWIDICWDLAIQACTLRLILGAFPIIPIGFNPLLSRFCSFHVCKMRNLTWDSQFGTFSVWQGNTLVEWGAQPRSLHILTQEVLPCWNIQWQVMILRVAWAIGHFVWVVWQWGHSHSMFMSFRILCFTQLNIHVHYPIHSCLSSLWWSDGWKMENWPGACKGEKMANPGFEPATLQI